MTVRHLARVGLLAAVVAAVGCGGEPRRAVAGRVAVAVPAADLAGHLVEVASPTDPNVRGSGVIESDGRFRLTALERGQPYPGLRDGTYQARLVLVDEGDGRAKKPKLPPRYLDFRTSGWSVQVPADGEVVLTVAAK